MIIKIKKNHIYLGIFLIIFIAFLVFFLNVDRRLILVGKNGLLTIKIPTQVEYQSALYQKNENYTINTLQYSSFGKEIYGFLVMPNASKAIPGLVLLPGAGVDKKSELQFAKKLSQEGYAVLTIDQRGIGETGGDVISFDEDFKSYANGDIPFQHLVIADALAAVEVLREQNDVDRTKIAIVGESLGGRIAIIAGAIDKDIKGVVGISTAGFHYSPKENENSRFISSIDPDNYIASISPRRLFMFHNYYDKNVPFQSALETFGKAKKPKKFILVNDTGCNHGFCESMFADIKSSIESIFRS